MKRAVLVIVFFALSVGPAFPSEAFLSITGLGVFQYGVFQGVAPGLSGYLELDNLLVTKDYFKTDPSFYYVGFGYVSDCTVQYGYQFRMGAVTVIPTVGFGLNFGQLGGIFYNAYVPVSLIVGLINTDRLELRCWAQIQNYFAAQDGMYYHIGGKVAVDLAIRWDNWGLYVEPIGGGGGSQGLIGLRVGTTVRW